MLCTYLYVDQNHLHAKKKVIFYKVTKKIFVFNAWTVKHFLSDEQFFNVASLRTIDRIYFLLSSSEVWP